MGVFLCRNQQADSKIYGEMQKLWHSKEAQHKGLTLSFLLIIELEWAMLGQEPINQWHRIWPENRFINVRVQEEHLETAGENRVLVNDDASVRYPDGDRMKLDPSYHLTPQTKLNSEWTVDLPVKR